MIRLFCGFDRREGIGLHVFMSSVLAYATQPVSFVPLSSLGFAQGSNAFTLSRFQVAAMCGFKGHAIFCDGSDMLALDDIARLDGLFDPNYAVQVVKHPTYVSVHERKYVGTEMEVPQSSYHRKNWASVMLVNCEHHAWQRASEYLANGDMLGILQFSFLSESEIGDLPSQWNVLVDERQYDVGAKLLHWTAGIPHFPHYANAPRALDWFIAERRSR